MSRLFVSLTAETGPDFKSHAEHGRLEKKSSRSISRLHPYGGLYLSKGGTYIVCVKLV